MGKELRIQQLEFLVLEKQLLAIRRKRMGDSEVADKTNVRVSKRGDSESKQMRSFVEKFRSQLRQVGSRLSIGLGFRSTEVWRV